MRLASSWLRHCSVAMSVLFATSLAAQATWIVDVENRAGAQFVTLQAAVDAAAPGDILWLRASQTLGYAAPTIDGKGVTVVGETGAGPVFVQHMWTIRNLPAQQRVVLRGLEMANRTAYFQATNNAGAIVLQDNQISAGPSFLPFGFGTQFTDCALVVISRGTVDTNGTPWTLVRTRLMVDGATLRSSPYNGSLIFSPGVIRAEDSEIRIGNSTLIGPSAPLTGATSANWASPPLILSCGVDVYVGGDTVLQGGVTRGGFLNEVAWNDCDTWRDPATWPWLHVDPSTQLIGGMAPFVAPDNGPQSGLRTSTTAGTILVDQYATPSAPVLLLLAPLQTTPWTHVLGPVFLDPTNLWSDLAVSPVTGPLRRTFAIPPGIPFGSTVGAQAFELTAQGQLLASNATLIGVW